MRRRGFTLVLGVAAALACEKSEGPMSSLDEFHSTIPGVYRGNHVLEGTVGADPFEETHVITSCSGEVVITSASEGRVEGTVTLDSGMEGCQLFAGSGAFTGTLSSKRSLSMLVSGLEELREEIGEAAFGPGVPCTRTGASTRFKGTLVNERLRVSVTFCDFVDPLSEEPVRLDWWIDVRKVS